MDMWSSSFYVSLKEPLIAAISLSRILLGGGYTFPFPRPGSVLVTPLQPCAWWKRHLQWLQGVETLLGEVLKTGFLWLLTGFAPNANLSSILAFLCRTPMLPKPKNSCHPQVLRADTFPTQEEVTTR